jgi:hypothetical protein
MKCFLFTLEQYELNNLNVYKHRYLISYEVFHMTIIFKPCLFRITSKITFDDVSMLWVLCKYSSLK